MQNLRRWHFNLSCLFSPLLIYFALSGAWQTLRFNDIPKGTTPTRLQSFFHEFSKPHKQGTLPAQDPKSTQSKAFNVFALAMGIGIVITSFLGIGIALQMGKRRRLAIILIFVGTVLPMALLFFRS